MNCHLQIKVLPGTYKFYLFSPLNKKVTPDLVQVIHCIKGETGWSSLSRSWKFVRILKLNSYLGEDILFIRVIILIRKDKLKCTATCNCIRGDIWKPLPPCLIVLFRQQNHNTTVVKWRSFYGSEYRIEMLCLHREPGKYIIYKIRSWCKVVIRILFLKTALLVTEH